MKDHRFITVERILKTGVVNFLRNIWISIAAIAMITITLTILLFAIVANATFANSITDLTSRIDVSVYLKDSVTEQQSNQLIADLKKVENVKSIEYVSKEQALKDFREDHANDPETLSAVSETDNTLPASLKVKPNDPNRLQTIKDFLDKKEIQALQSEPTSYSGERKEAIDSIAKATDFFRKAGIVGIIVFIIISMLIIFNTIRMAIFNRRDELIIMRLLGASPWYIKGPFVVETMMYGIMAAIVSIVIVWGLFAIASTLEVSSLLDIDFSRNYFSRHLWLIVIAQIGAGIIIGAASSAVATRRYLKLK
ncbi:hypothetical protein A3F65_00290 [Candidatus Saccharibacteria bacterium RIFCSPHIGHO2_12_FULL_47_16b]|nr:MAG: hypothetical protein A3F65_00290 [Candidatus Saccharibacteria bacterium RIFCSPHIGHO2_12_FULL_47_16b]